MSQHLPGRQEPLLRHPQWHFFNHTSRDQELTPGTYWVGPVIKKLLPCKHTPWGLRLYPYHLKHRGAPLVAQWLRIRLAVPGMQVESLVRELGCQVPQDQALQPERPNAAK